MDAKNEQNTILDHERLENISYGNWKALPLKFRMKCIETLRKWISGDIINEWKEHRKQRIAIGGGGTFHLFTGAILTNRLHETFGEDELLPVKDDQGIESKNWERYYRGALREFIESEVKGSKS